MTDTPQPCPEYLHGWNDCARMVHAEAPADIRPALASVLQRLPKPDARKLLKAGEVQRMFAVTRTQIAYAVQQGDLRAVRRRPNSHPMYHIDACRKAFRPPA